MKKTTVELIDDLDGSVLAGGSSQTVHFALDAVAYELDLSIANADALREVFAPYIKAGRRVSSGRGPSKRAARIAVTSSARPGNIVVRAWAKENGLIVSDRGKLSAAVLTAYAAAHS